MATRITELAEDLLSALRLAPNEFDQEQRIEAATQLYAQERVSQGKGAEIAGLSRSEFIDALSRRRIPVSQETFDELMEAIRRED
jgi:predicted HTH domain antitoxin